MREEEEVQRALDNTELVFQEIGNKELLDPEDVLFGWELALKWVLGEIEYEVEP